MSTVSKMVAKLVSVTPFTRELAIQVYATLKKRKYKTYKDSGKTRADMVMFESYMARKYACSPKALYEEMCRNPKYDGIKKIWAFTNPSEHEELCKNPDTILVKYKSEEYYRYYSQAKYWFSNSRLPNEISPRADQVYVQCWHGTPLKRLGLDVRKFGGNKAETRELHRNYRADAKRFRWMLSPSPFYTEKIASAFDLKALGKEDIFLELGYPRNDVLYTYEESEARKLKERMGLPMDKKLILYAPTWRENQHIAGEGYTYKLGLDFDKLQEELGDKAVILFRAHYFISNSFDFSKYQGFIYDVSMCQDINDLYLVADLLITDYSSVFFDYANLKRPMIFYMYDYDEYKNQMRDFYFGVEELPGPIIKEQNELSGEIHRLLTEFVYDEKYRQFNEKFNPYPGACSAKVLEKIIEEA